ncbi:MAG: hypothetical protein J07AB43_16100 [Candidatus Nanosalina sp. J07AB43]|nr:MAG: hypothetical protein J07AB43_16100 [Candidatus Nanosalina sp. J07AB43]
MVSTLLEDLRLQGELEEIPHKPPQVTEVHQMQVLGLLKLAVLLLS